MTREGNLSESDGPRIMCIILIYIVFEINETCQSEVLKAS